MERLRRIRKYIKEYLNKNIIKRRIAEQSKEQGENIPVKYKKQKGY